MKSLKKEVEEIKADQAESGKSSLGDKYETSAELTRAELEKLEAQYAQFQKFKHQVETFTNLKASSTVIAGSLVKTNNGIFLIGISFGPFKANELSVFAISTLSPIGQKLIGKKEGDAIEQNGKIYQIEHLG